MQFHQVSIITRYLTRNPKLEASIELKAITSKLKVSKGFGFETMVTKWEMKLSGFLKERTVNVETNK